MAELLGTFLHVRKVTREELEKRYGKPRKPPMCEECGKNRADPPGKLCVGCEAYRDHTGHF